MSSDLDVLIFHHPTEDPDRPILFPAMGLVSLADWLDMNGYRARVVHVGIERSLDPGFDPVSLLEDAGARIAAISAHWFFQLPDSLDLARLLKESLPELTVVLGGYSASFFAREIVERHPRVDVVVRGEGEVPLLELTRCVVHGGGEGMDRVPNLVLRGAGGNVMETSFSHVATPEQLAGYRFSRLELMRHHEEWLRQASFPTQKFRDRIAPRSTGLFPVEVGRGCPYSCTFCGGNRQAQRLVNNRRKAVFRPPEEVIGTVREAMEHGVRHFYTCFDPDPNGIYYRRLFQLVREERLDIRWIFGAWALPSRSFVDEFRDTFEDGLFEISPETAVESLRDRSKGAVSFSNRDLEATLSHIADRDLLCQLFFGFYLPGDTPESVMATRLYARRLESDHCEPFYLAFSTDPGSLLHLHPEEHEVHMDVGDLDSYLRALGDVRASPNLLAHRPATMSREDATRVELGLAIDAHVHKLFPLAVRALGLALDDRELADASVLDAAMALAAPAGAAPGVPPVSRIADAMRGLLGPFGLEPEPAHLVEDLIRWESAPYLLYEEEIGEVSTHYSFAIQAAPMTREEREEFLASPGTVSATRVFGRDPRALAASVERGELAAPPPVELRLGLAVDPSGRLVVWPED